MHDGDLWLCVCAVTAVWKAGEWDFREFAMTRWGIQVLGSLDGLSVTVCGFLGGLGWIGSLKDHESTTYNHFTLR